MVPRWQEEVWFKVRKISTVGKVCVLRLPYTFRGVSRPSDVARLV